MTIGERLRKERERLGLSQPKFAALASTTKQTLFSWETGKTAPDGFQFEALATAGVDVLYILTGITAKGQADIALHERASKLQSADDADFQTVKKHSAVVRTAMRNAMAPQLTPRQQALLDNYAHASEEGKKVIEGTASLAAKSKAA